MANLLVAIAALAGGLLLDQKVTRRKGQNRQKQPAGKMQEVDRSLLEVPANVPPAAILAAGAGAILLRAGALVLRRNKGSTHVNERRKAGGENGDAEEFRMNGLDINKTCSENVQLSPLDRADTEPGPKDGGAQGDQVSQGTVTLKDKTDDVSKQDIQADDDVSCAALQVSSGVDENLSKDEEPVVVAGGSADGGEGTPEEDEWPVGNLDGGSEAIEEPEVGEKAEEKEEEVEEQTESKGKTGSYGSMGGKEDHEVSEKLRGAVAPASDVQVGSDAAVPAEACEDRTTFGDVGVAQEADVVAKVAQSLKKIEPAEAAVDKAKDSPSEQSAVNKVQQVQKKTVSGYGGSDGMFRVVSVFTPLQPLPPPALESPLVGLRQLLVSLPESTLGSNLTQSVTLPDLAKKPKPLLISRYHQYEVHCQAPHTVPSTNASSRPSMAPLTRQWSQIIWTDWVSLTGKAEMVEGDLGHRRALAEAAAQ